MKLLITLLLSTLALFIYVNRSYKYASLQDEVEDSSNWKGFKKGTLYLDEQGNKISFEIEPPIDYESDKYKESEAWFTGMGRC